ncbi:hypothetical protein BXZ70DRAFT_369918 [Cristinia sonorae]|uniref:BTB domain-containing protein n=1 Tax=Cristinia sonorae TaxID=1940300 RepID=A0A8K0UIP5_9AGAR|nr:hypothetical protein BXZ70DRAFT_369918 [Cristinia sonorae]
MQADAQPAQTLDPLISPPLFISSSTGESESAGPSYHPLFNSPDGDTVLGSKNGVLFRVHSFTLKTTSGWFRTMFSLPQRSGSSTSDSTQETAVASTSSGTLSENIIYVDEDSTTLESLLRLISGLPIPKLDSYDTIEPLLYAAEKYDMPGPLSLVRALISTSPFTSDPLRLYTLCCRYGWTSEAQSASTQSLTLNIHSPTHRPTLLKLSTTALLNLVDLHYARRDTLRTRLNEPPFVNDDSEASCSHCGVLVKYHTWRELKFVICSEMDVRPMGDTVLEKGLNEWPAAKACWSAKCKSCDRVLYDKEQTLRAIRQVIDKLPSKVE